MQSFDDKENALSPVVPLNEDRLKEMLKNPKVDYVKVKEFPILLKGDILSIGVGKFEITKVLKGGRYVIKRKM